MNNIFKNIAGVLVLVVIVLLTVGLLFNSLTKKSFYEESGSVKVKGISNKISIYKSEFGVSQIFADNENDMYYALGYAHAQDRLWQMDLSRRVAEGKLSEIFGKDVLEFDILFRTLAINKTADKLYEKLSTKSKSILISYCSGVNDFIKSNSSHLPLEFDILNYKPETWKPEHSLMIIRLMGWELNLSWYTDYMFGRVINKLGYEKASDLFPDYPEDAPFIVKDAGGKIRSDSTKTVSKDKKTSYFQNPEDETGRISKSSELASDYFSISRNYREFFGIKGTHVGSNSWVVSGNKTESGKPLIANDPHLALQVPSKWYEASLYDNQKKYSVCGFTIPGVPGIAIGHNDVVAWGLTNLMCDDSDFWILKRDSAEKHKYRFQDEVMSLDSSVESIKIKDVPDEYVFTTYSTKLGPVISNLERTGFINKQKFHVDNPDEILTFRWTGYEVSDEIQTFYEINHAMNYEEFRTALKSFGVPALNFVYADTSGNIAYHSAGLIPIRKNPSGEAQSFFPFTGNVSWSGFVPFDELPSSVNPKENYIVTANNKPLNGYNHYISNLYEPRYRADRIEEMLASNPIVTEQDVKRMQVDVMGLQAIEFCGHLFAAFGDTANLTSDIRNYFDMLRQWDFEFKTNSTAATLFAQFEIELYKNLYRDALGDGLFADYLFIKNIPVRNTSKILKMESCSLFENKFRKEQILRKSFYDAVSALITRYGEDVNKWQWGEVHKVIMKHPLGMVPSLSSMLNIGPFKIGGSGTTIDNLEYGFTNAIETGEFECYLGPSMRMIVDLSFIKRYLSIIPTGQSGQPLHRNYNDQARLWLNGDYKKVSTDFEDLKKQNLKLLTLEPGE